MFRECVLRHVFLGTFNEFASFQETSFPRLHVDAGRGLMG